MAHRAQRIASVVFAFCFWTTAPAQPATGRPAFSAFDVATIKQVDPDRKSSRFIKLDGHRFVVKDYSLKLLIAAAYDLSPKAVSGGPAWVEADHFEILATIPGDVRPSRYEQMAMLRALLAERFKLSYHRQEQQFSLYTLELARKGSHLKQTELPPDEPPALVSTVYPQRIHLPTRNVTMGQFASLLQRAVLDRPVVDKTGLAGRFDFDLDWAPDESQFGGEVPVASADAPSPPFFVAVEQQLGLKLVAGRGPVQALVVDGAERPTPN